MKRLSLKFYFSIFLLSLSVTLPRPLWAQSQGDPSISEESKVVKSIEVKGNKTISLSTILSKIKTRVGDKYIQSVISDDLKRLYNTGYFSDVRVDREDYQGGLKVILYLDEKPIVDEVTFSKIKYLNAKMLRRKIKTKAGQFLDKKVLTQDIDLIKDLYAQKGLTLAEVEVETFLDETTNKASLHFIIREGYKIFIKKINFHGNTAYKDKKLRKIIKTKAKGLFRLGYLKEEILDEDMERLRSFYEQQGFIDVKVDYKIDYLYQGQTIVDIQIDEGRRYSVGNISIEGNKIISDKEILSVLSEMKEGGIFSRQKLDVDVTNIRTLYFDRGYIFADINESTSFDPETGKVDLTFNIKEGQVAYIEKVKIQGNTRTRDIVIRRELKLHPGDRFDGSKLRRSKERLSNLGYFEDVGFDIEDTGTKDRKDLVVQVKEAKTGTFSFGGGFSTIDRMVGLIEVKQRNFDFTNWPSFTGGGQELELRAETGSTKNNVYLSFTEPWLFDYPISGGFDGYRLERERSDDTGYAYDQKKIGGDIRFGKRFSEYVSGSMKYKFEEITIDNMVDNVSADLAAEIGTNKVSSAGFDLVRDSRDNVFSPTRGLYLSGGLDFAGGFIGGDKDFYRLSTQNSYYVPLFFNSVLEFRVQAGMVDAYDDSDKVPIFERFFAGGARTIRGYDERTVGPLDSNTQDPIGGESMLVGNVEITFPIVEFLKFATFLDSGNVWKDVNDFASGDFKSGMGAGLRIKTPIGPVNLDYGYPLNDEPGEDGRSGKFYFSVSRGF